MVARKSNLNIGSKFRGILSDLYSSISIATPKQFLVFWAEEITLLLN